ncbi:MAG: hypothetical protein ABIM89_01445 [Mycobacteriales bacterium]
MPRLIAVLLGATALLFAIAASAERSSRDHREVTLSGALLEGGADGRPSEQGAGEHSEAGEETLLGLDLESPLLVGVGVLLSLGLAAAVWSRPTSTVIAAAGLFSAGFAILDLVEARHQVSEGTGPLVGAAIALVLGHALAAVAAALVLVRSRQTARCAWPPPSLRSTRATHHQR